MLTAANHSGVGVGGWTLPAQETMYHKPRVEGQGAKSTVSGRALDLWSKGRRFETR